MVVDNKMNTLSKYYVAVVAVMVLAICPCSFGAEAASNARPVSPCPDEWLGEARHYVERGLVPSVLIMAETPEWGLCVGTVGNADLGEGTAPTPAMRRWTRTRSRSPPSRWRPAGRQTTTRRTMRSAKHRRRPRASSASTSCSFRASTCAWTTTPCSRRSTSRCPSSTPRSRASRLAP